MLSTLPSPLRQVFHVSNYPGKNDPHVFHLGTPGPFFVCDRQVLLTAASVAFRKSPGLAESYADYNARHEQNQRLALAWTASQGLIPYPDEIAARATVGQLPLDPERGALGPWVTVVNPRDHEEERLYLLEFGAAGKKLVLVWARREGDAVERAAEWLAEHAPGHLVLHGSPELEYLVNNARDDLGESADDDAAFEKATENLIDTESGFLTAGETRCTEAHPELRARAKTLCEMGEST